MHCVSYKIEIPNCVFLIFYAFQLLLHVFATMMLEFCYGASREIIAFRPNSHVKVNYKNNFIEKNCHCL